MRMVEWATVPICPAGTACHRGRFEVCRAHSRCRSSPCRPTDRLAYGPRDQSGRFGRARGTQCDSRSSHRVLVCPGSSPRMSASSRSTPLGTARWRSPSRTPTERSVSSFSTAPTKRSWIWRPPPARPSTATARRSGSLPRRCGSGWPASTTPCSPSPPATWSRCHTRSSRPARPATARGPGPAWDRDLCRRGAGSGAHPPSRHGPAHRHLPVPPRQAR